MYKGSLAVLAALVCTGSSALALPLDPTSVSGTATLRVGNAGGSPSMFTDTTPIAFPEAFSNTLTAPFTGAVAEVDYTLEAIGESAVFDFYSKDVTGEGGDNHDGHVSVNVSLTTTSDSIYSFTAIDPYSPDTGIFSFIATFNGIVASKYFNRDAPGGVDGTFPTNPSSPGSPPSNTFFDTGFLPAGTYTLTIDQGGSYRGYSGMHDSKVNLTLEPVPEFSTMMLSMLGLGRLALWRRHRA